MESNLKFRPIQFTDVPLIHRWFNAPHVMTFYSLRRWTEQEVLNKLKPYILGKDPVYGFIVTMNGNPIGYIQQYSVKDYPWPNQQLPDEIIQNSAGFDMFIGEFHLIGKGLGKKIAFKFIEDYIWPKFRHCILDPDVRNHRAIRCYETLNFRQHMDITSKNPLGKDVNLKLMILKKPTNDNLLPKPQLLDKVNSHRSFESSEIQEQISQCLTLLKEMLGKDLLGVYLYGSSILGGLQKFSDLDLFVILNRSTTYQERAKLVSNLLQISGIYLKTSKPPIEMTMVVKSEVNPWLYPAKFDFQYGDWLRATFEAGHIEPSFGNEMPDLAILITQVLLASKVLYGPNPADLLCKVPYRDFLLAQSASLNSLAGEIHSDTRNVLLTYARIWQTLETNTLCSKQEAAMWVLDRLSEVYKPVMMRAYSISIGRESEYWNDLQSSIEPTAAFIHNQIDNLIALIESSGYEKRSINIKN